MSNIKKNEIESNLDDQDIQKLTRSLIEKSISIKKDDQRYLIADVLFMVGSFLDLNRIFVSCEILNEPIEWFNSNTTTKLNQISPLLQSSSFHFPLDALKIGEIVSITQNNPLHEILRPLELNDCFALSILIFDKTSGVIIFEMKSANYIFSALELVLLKQMALTITSAIQSIHLEEELIDLKDKKDQANLVKEQFLTNVSHEIKTPMSGIYNAMYLLGTTDLNDEQKEFLDIAHASLEQLSSVIDDILDISKLESGKMEILNAPFDVEEEMLLISRMQKNFAAEKGLEIKLSNDPSINFDLIGDSKKIRQVLLNLINNAIKYTDSGEVKIATKLISETPLVVEFSISDTGSGIDEQEISSLYESFYRKDGSLSRKDQGLGLGLPIANNIIKLLGGTLDIDSELDKGTSFTIQLPFMKGEPYTYPSVNQLNALFTSEYPEDHVSYTMLQSMGIRTYTIHQANDIKFDLIIFEGDILDIDLPLKLKKQYGKQNTLNIIFRDEGVQRLEDIDCTFNLPVSRKFVIKSINKALGTIKPDRDTTTKYSSMIHGYALIVDDNRLNRVTLESILKRQGIRSKSVDSGAKAIEAVLKESFDIILMDMQMPQMDGIEATRKIRHLGRNQQSIPIIAVTANTFLKDYDLMKTAQINDVIFKPIQMEQLNKMMRKHIKSSHEVHIPDDLFIFDVNDFMMRFEGSYDIADEVIESFISEYLNDLEKIRTSIMSKDPQDIIRDVHYFKGSCAYLSGKRSVWIINLILNAAKDNELSDMELYMDILEIEVKALVLAIQEYQHSK